MKRTKLPQNEILTLNEMAQYLKLSRSTAYKLAQEGKIPGTKVGRHWRFHREELAAFVRSGKK